MAPAFLMWQLNSDTVYTQALLDVTGATSPHVNVDTIRNFWLVQPPFEEQVTISDCLDRATAQFDMLSTKVRAAIEKLREYRAALISAAVTGKIDVRGELSANKPPRCRRSCGIRVLRDRDGTGG